MATSNGRASNDTTSRLGSGGELHQSSSAPETRITTNHGVPISDNQNSLKGGQRGPTLLEDFVLREKSSTSITSAFPSASFTPAGQRPMASSN